MQRSTANVPPPEEHNLADVQWIGGAGAEISNVRAVYRDPFFRNGAPAHPSYKKPLRSEWEDFKFRVNVASETPSENPSVLSHMYADAGACAAPRAADSRRHVRNVGKRLCASSLHPHHVRTQFACSFLAFLRSTSICTVPTSHSPRGPCLARGLRLLRARRRLFVLRPPVRKEAMCI